MLMFKYARNQWDRQHAHAYMKMNMAPAYRRAERDYIKVYSFQSTWHKEEF